MQRKEGRSHAKNRAAEPERDPGPRGKGPGALQITGNNFGVFVNGRRATLYTPLNAGAKVYVLTAMSGG